MTLERNYNNKTSRILQNLCYIIQIQTIVRKISISSQTIALLIACCSGSDGTCSYLTEQFVKNFKAFQDIHQYNDQEIYILKKAQLLCADLYRQLHNTYPRFKFPDFNQLTVMSDNVLPAVLRTFGVLELGPSLATHIDSAAILPPGNLEIELRAVAVAVCQLIVEEMQAVRPGFSALELDFYLWCKGKDPIFRKVERHYTTDTVYY
jgi:hypothetical protein